MKKVYRTYTAPRIRVVEMSTDGSMAENVVTKSPGTNPDNNLDIDEGDGDDGENMVRQAYNVWSHEW